MTEQQLKELNDWLDVEIQKYSDAIKAESDIYDAACLSSFQRVKEKINELTNIYSLIPLDKEVADKFISNCLNIESSSFKTIDEIRDYIKEYGFKNCLDGAFYWDDSLEKGTYWYEIYSSL